MNKKEREKAKERVAKRWALLLSDDFTIKHAYRKSNEYKRNRGIAKELKVVKSKNNKIISSWLLSYRSKSKKENKNINNKDRKRFAKILQIMTLGGLST